jgi:adenine-specific DNA methylase
MSRKKLLIEQWLPIETIGAECMREKALGLNTFPATHRLHVWWARRPLTASRASILASLLPAYPTEEDSDIRPWPERFRILFPTFDSYKEWFLRLNGILGNSAIGRRLIVWAKLHGVTLTARLISKLPPEWREGLPNNLTTNIPYGYPRAFTINPTEEHLQQFQGLLEWTWGTREIAFCDPMSGGGSIPFEALRYGLTVHANELNSVASVILKATLDLKQA